MKTLHRKFIEELKASLHPDSVKLSKFITDNTYLEGKKFSYLYHEFQQYIVELIEQNMGFTFCVSKCSQIGLSEIFNRVILARMAIRPSTSALISFPSITFSNQIFKTRLAQAIRESPKLRNILDKNNDSASVKAFTNGSIAYALGGADANSNTSLLNRPISTVLVDEFDRQSLKIITGYRSRMKHTPKKERLVMWVSTPTVADIGIDAQIKASGQVHTPWVGCEECGHEFIADFYEDVVIPGYDEEMLLLSKERVAGLDLEESYLQCPECKAKLDNDNKKTVWKITYNPEGKQKQIGVTLDPFVALGFYPISDLVEAALEYESDVEFLNQELGKTANRSDSTIDRKVLHFEHSDNTDGQRVYGLDMGKMCTWLEGVVRPDTTVHILSAELVKLTEIEAFLEKKESETVYTAGVADSQPYSDLIYRLIKKYPRLYSALYVSPNPPKPELFTLKMRDDFEEVVRQVTINKSLAMDDWANSLDAFWTWEPTHLEATIIKHIEDMRRVRDYRFDEMIYKWAKSAKGVDHFFHAAVYLYMATKLASAGIAQVFSVPTIIRTMNPERRRLARGRRQHA